MFDYLPALLTLLGVLLAAAASFWSTVRSSEQGRKRAEERAEYERRLAEKSEQIAAKSEEIAELAIKAAQAVTGGDSFCFFGFLYLESGRARLVIHHNGDFPLYDVQARIVDLEKYREPHASQTLNEVFRDDINVTVGNVASGSARIAGRWTLPDVDRKSYNVFFSGRNGFWTQLIRLRRINGKWISATKVTRHTESGGSETLHEDVNQDFPRNQRGEVDWASDREE